MSSSHDSRTTEAGSAARRSRWSLSHRGLLSHHHARGRAGRLLVLPVAALMLVLGAACSGGDDPTPTPTPTPTAATSTASASATATRTPTATAGASATAATEETPEGTVVRSVGDLVSNYGYPADATFARLRIPTLGVDAQVSSRFVGTDGVMTNPEGPAHVVWYDMSAWSSMGGAPGGGGNAIFSGHVDYAANVGYAGVYYRGQGVFSQIRLLSAGDIIEVDYGGETLRYAVEWRQQLGATGADWGAIWSSNVATDSITIYTCGGEFDFTTRSYADRVVVRAQRVF